MSSSTDMLFTGWEVGIGRNCAGGLEYRPEGTVSPKPDRLRPVNNIFIFFTAKFQENFYSGLQTMCVEVGRVRVDEGRDRLPTKTKHHCMIFNLQVILSQLSSLLE